MPAAAPIVPDARADIAASIDRTLREEARRNEIGLTWLRVALLGVMCVLDWIAVLAPGVLPGMPPIPLALPLVITIFLAGSTLLLLLLRRGWYRAWLAYAAPLLDTAMLLVTVLVVRAAMPVEAFVRSGVLTNSAMAAMLIASTGGLRFRISAGVWTTALSFVVLAVLAWGALPAGEVFYLGALLGAAGFLGTWMAGLVRRSMHLEVGRTILRRFLPGAVVDGSIRAPLDLVTTPRSLVATVLVSDLRGFTSLSESRDPAEVFSYLNRIQGALAEIVHAHGGTVDKFLGDGMLAVFGAPEPLPDHAARAVAAAEAMRQAMCSLPGIGGTGSAPAFGIGIHAGAVIAGALGSGARLEFTVIGDTVNTASRLESLTKELGVDVLVSENAATLSGRTDLVSRGSVAVRGRTQSIVVFTIPGAAPAALADAGR